MNRRVFVAQALLPLIVSADAESDTWQTVAAMAAGLAEGNPAAFLKPVDRGLANYSVLERNVCAMLELADAQSNISPLANDGSELARTLQLDWELRLKRKSDGNDEPRIVAREEAVTVGFEKDGKKWRVVKLEPLSFFAPPEFR
jgi:hypothetical protein